MYHYVRRLDKSRYPEIKGLERELFEQQIAYIRKFYTPVTGHQVVDAVRGRVELPKNALLLSFDDGYLDHFTTVFPILQREKLSGIFFPPARSVLEGALLDVNKIHYLLAAVLDKNKLVASIDKAIEEAKNEYEVKSPSYYRNEYAIANRLDAAEVIYIKRMLQVGLPRKLRLHILDDLFSSFVTSDHESFAREIYMDEDQVRCLADAGMMIGSHGYNHEWMDQLSYSEQITEIDLSLDFLRQIGVATTDWAMCYPYGAWSPTLLEILRSKQCAMAFTTEVDVADLTKCDPLLLPRLDTNDLPKSSGASAVDWTIKSGSV